MPHEEAWQLVAQECPRRILAALHRSGEYRHGTSPRFPGKDPGTDAGRGGEPLGAARRTRAVRIGACSRPRPASPAETGTLCRALARSVSSTYNGPTTPEKVRQPGAQVSLWCSSARPGCAAPALGLPRVTRIAVPALLSDLIRPGAT
jgi:hypothetical protein